VFDDKENILAAIIIIVVVVVVVIAVFFRVCYTPNMKQNYKLKRKSKVFTPFVWVWFT